MIRAILPLTFLIVLAATPAEAQVRPGGRRAAMRVERGTASFYAARFHGRRTASGERYNHQAMTVAHRTLPFGTLLRITNERNGRSITVRVNDRGPFIRGRIVDLSGAAARQLGVTGLAPVTIETVTGEEAEPEPEVVLPPPPRADFPVIPVEPAPPVPLPVEGLVVG
jgi:rare lipoprotein A (peptidoglycan hydrolase)